MFPNSVRLDFTYPEVRLVYLSWAHCTWRSTPPPRQRWLWSASSAGLALPQEIRWPRPLAPHAAWHVKSAARYLEPRQVQNLGKQRLGTKKDPTPFEDKLLVAMFLLSISMAPAFSRFVDPHPLIPGSAPPAPTRRGWCVANLQLPMRRAAICKPVATKLLIHGLSSCSCTRPKKYDSHTAGNGVWCQGARDAQEPMLQARQTGIMSCTSTSIGGLPDAFLWPCQPRVPTLCKKVLDKSNKQWPSTFNAGLYQVWSLSKFAIALYILLSQLQINGVATLQDLLERRVHESGICRLHVSDAFDDVAQGLKTLQQQGDILNKKLDKT